MHSFQWSCTLAVLLYSLYAVATNNVCNAGVIGYLAPLAEYPPAQSFCAQRYPPATVTVTAGSVKWQLLNRRVASTSATTKPGLSSINRATTTPARQDPKAELCSSLYRAASDVAKTFCACILPPKTVTVHTTTPSRPAGSVQTTKSSTKPASTLTTVTTTKSTTAASTRSTTSSSCSTTKSRSTSSATQKTTSTTTAKTTSGTSTQTSLSTSASTTTKVTTSTTPSTAPSTTPFTSTISTTSSSLSTTSSSSPIPAVKCGDGSDPIPFYTAQNGDVYGRCFDTDSTSSWQQSINSGTPETCTDACSRTPNCDYFNFVRISEGGRGFSCVLKSAIGASSFTQAGTDQVVRLSRGSGTVPTLSTLTTTISTSTSSRTPIATPLYPILCADGSRPTPFRTANNGDQYGICKRTQINSSNSRRVEFSGQPIQACVDYCSADSDCILFIYNIDNFDDNYVAVDNGECVFQGRAYGVSEEVDYVDSVILTARGSRSG